MTGFFRDDAGALSCMRLMCFISTCAILLVWALANLRAGQYLPLGWAEASLLCAAHGGKAAQGYFEYGGGNGQN